jgi:hypothetical protein
MKYDEYKTELKLVESFLEIFIEEKNDAIGQVVDNLDLKIDVDGVVDENNHKIISTILHNSNIELDEPTIEVLATTASIINSDAAPKKEIKSLLEELKLMGVGNSLVKKVCDFLVKTDELIRQKNHEVNSDIVDKVGNFLLKNKITLDTYQKFYVRALHGLNAAIS